MKRDSNNKYKKILKRMQKKLWIVFGLFCIFFVFLIIVLMWIQFTSGDKYEKIVLKQQNVDGTVIPFQRGDIVDSKGTVLATSVDVYNVILDCSTLNANKDKIDTTIDAVTECIPEITEDDIRTALKKKKDSKYVILAKKVSYEEVSAYEALEEDENKKDGLKGIWFEKEYVRNYPYNSLAASVIGFVTSGDTGVIGLETEYNDELNGVNGRSYGYLDDNNVNNTVVEPENGHTLVTTLDANVQSVVESELKAFADSHASDGEDGVKNAACIVMNPNTGEIIAMANYPTFDLNNPRDLSAYYTEEELANMSDDDKLDKLNAIWQNYCITSTYEPGSTMKPFTVACGLETGTVSGDETYVCDGSETVSGHVIHCVNRDGHGTETIAQVLSNSCNDAMMQMVSVIGADNFSEYQSLFGFGQKTGIDLPGEASTKDLIYSKEELQKSASNLATNAFGQNFNVTMVQMASAFCSLVNGGNYYKPHIVSEIKDSSGNVTESIEPVIMEKTVSSEVSAQINSYLREVVENGTASSVQIDGYDIGGKTGTAEKLPRSEHKYLVSFIGVVPCDNPELVIYTIVDEPNVADQAHSTYAQEITRNVLQQILPYMNITRKTTTESTEE